MTEAPLEGSLDWPLMPTETEIYILPVGRVVIADMPAELNDLVSELGPVEPCSVEPCVVESDRADGASGRPLSASRDDA